MRPVVLISCGLLAVPTAGWAQSAPPGSSAALRCAVAVERMPRMMELGVELARNASRDVPAARAALPELEKSLEEARPAMSRMVKQARAQALASVGGDSARLEQEMEALRRTYPPAETLSANDPAALAIAAEGLKADMQQCEVVAKSTAPSDPG